MSRRSRPEVSGLVGQLDKIKYGYEASLVPMLHVGKIPPEVNDVNEVEGAFVEIHFELRHFCIYRESKDSFNATVMASKESRLVL